MTIRRLTLSNILSFGPRAHDVVLGPLNVVIGANGCGKSNFVEVLNLIQALPTDLSDPIREGGGIREWQWKGGSRRSNPVVEVEFDAEFAWFRHRVELDAKSLRTRIVEEIVERADLLKGGQRAEWKQVFHLEPEETSYEETSRPTDPHAQSFVARAGAPEFAVWFDVAYSDIAIYRDWSTGKRSPLRIPQPADLPNHSLMPSGENLGLVLSALQRDSNAWDALREAMSRFYPAFKDLQVITQGGTVQVFIREKGLATPIPATRLSDGTLRFLALLSVLLHPNPPDIVVMEEPEQGLHPDVVRDLARYLEEASTRCQVIVTTHSHLLVDALSHRPEAVLVAERGADGTTLSRLERSRLSEWLEKYRLGELWLKGEIGGTRW